MTTRDHHGALQRTVVISMSTKAVGLDFGTTNSAIAQVSQDGAVALAKFPAGPERAVAETMRSILFFAADPHGDEPRRSVGDEAIDRYIASGANGRLIQSLKSFLADRLFDETNIMGDYYSLEDLITPILQRLRKVAEEQFGELPPRVVVGRPVHFSAAQNDADDQRATARLEAAIRRAGWKEITFEFEPVAAAYHYASTIAREELILVADFGGGTSDFSIVRLRPPSGTPAQHRYEILANDGVALAGDAFDGEIVRRLIAPELGRGSQYRTPYGSVLPMPTWFYAQTERWHFLSFLKAPTTINKLRDLEHQSLAPEKVRALIHIVENDLGYLLFKSVEQTKLALSDADTTTFRFVDHDVMLEKPATREAFESWIARELRSIAECVERVLAAAEVLPDSIDSVFLTGGSSFVPIVRRIFARTFGAEKIRTGSEFTSIARGLALRGLELAQS
jgi:hypothetical chaperone protein